MPVHALVALIRKDLVLYFSNRRALLMTLAAPIAIAAFFGSLFGAKGNEGPSQVPIAIVDRDASPVSTTLVAAMRADPTFDVKDLGEAAALEAVDRGKLRAVVVLDAGFGEEAPLALFGRRTKPVVTVRYDPSQAITLQLVEGLLAKHAMETVTRAAFGMSGDGASTRVLADARRDVEASTTLSTRERADLTGLFDAIERVQSSTGANASRASTDAIGFSLPYTVRETEAGARPESRYNSYAHSFVGMGVQFILFMGIDLGIKLLTARRLGLWGRLRAAPLSRRMLLGSQVASGGLIAAILFVLVFGAGMLLFGVRIEGSVAGFALLVLAFAVLVATFGLLIAAVGRTPDATRGLAIFATLVMVMLGGAWVPAFVFPAWLQTASLAIPTRWAVDGLDAVTWRGQGFDAAWLPAVVMLGFSFVFAVVATLRFDWDEA